MIWILIFNLVKSKYIAILCFNSCFKESLFYTTWKVSKYEVFAGPYFPYSVRIQENTDQKKIHIWTLSTQCLSPYNTISISLFVTKTFRACNGVLALPSKSIPPPKKKLVIPHFLCVMTCLSLKLPKKTLKPSKKMF